MSQDEQLNIRCAKCGQKFAVGEELRGRLVECGACETRFRVDDTSIIKGRKAYPGEKNMRSLQQFGKQPHLEFAKPTISSVQYAEAPNVERIEPAPMSKVLTGIIGGAGFFLAGLILITGAKKNGLLDGVSTDKRLIIAAFAALICSALVIFANAKSRKIAILAASIASAGLLCIPIFFSEASKVIPRNIVNTKDQVIDPIQSEKIKKDSLLKLRDEVGYAPMELAKSKAANPATVIGIWLKGISDVNTHLVADYLTRISGSDTDASQLYPRQSGDYLHVLIDSKMSLDKLVIECAELGRVNLTDAEAGLISVLVDNVRFEPRSEEKLADINGGAFYQLNLFELQSVDPSRVKQALKRLIQAPPTQSRADINERMLKLVPTATYDLFDSLCATLQKWSDGNDKAQNIVLNKANQFYAARKTIPDSAATLLLSWKTEAFYPLITQLWKEKPVTWESIYTTADSSAESYISEQLDQGSDVHRISAARIIGRIGTGKSLEKLQSLAASTTEPELKNNYENAIGAIRSRY